VNSTASSETEDTFSYPGHKTTNKPHFMLGVRRGENIAMAQTIPLIRQLGQTLATDSAAFESPSGLVSRPVLQRILGAIWLLDGLLQLQPVLFSRYLVDGVMQPTTQGQPEVVARGLQMLIDVTAQHVVPANASIAIIELTLGLCLLGNRLARAALLASIAWALAVWAGGEGFGMLLTGQASILTGAPGPALLYLILGVLAYPGTRWSEQMLRAIVAGFWVLAAALQLQPVWWRPGQIARTIAGNESPDTLQGVLFDPVLHGLTQATRAMEVPLNLGLVVLALALTVGVTMAPGRQLCPVLAISMGLSLLLWCATEGCGLLLTGTATDVSSGPLLVVLMLACWPRRRTAGRQEGRGRWPTVGIAVSLPQMEQR